MRRNESELQGKLWSKGKKITEALLIWGTRFVCGVALEFKPRSRGADSMQGCQALPVEQV